MVDLQDRNSVNEIVENGISTLQTILSYLLLPVALPMIFLQECIAWFREKVGLNDRSLEGKVVLITGASSGIGEALAHSFFDAGCKLILASRRKEELERVKNELIRKKASGSQIYVPAVLEMDVGDLASIPTKAAAALDVYNGVDILVNNAGILLRGAVLDTDIEIDRKVMDVNYFGSLALTKAIGRHMKGRKQGHIVFVSSVQGKLAIPNNSAYASSKHAMQALADSLRAEVSDFGIQVTLISPGYVKTNISVNALTSSGEQYGRMTDVIATGMTSEYVANRTVKAVLNGEKDLVISPLSPKLGIFLRYHIPSIIFILMRQMSRNYNNKKKSQ